MTILKKLKQQIVSRYHKFLDDRLLASLLHDVSTDDVPVVELLLKNQLSALNDNYLAEHASATSPALKKQLMLTSKQLIEKLLVLRGIVAIQPMQGPVGLVHLLQNKPSEENMITLEIVRYPVVAMSRRSQIRMPLEVMQDMRTLHGIDVESEITSAIAEEIVDGYTSDIINDLLMLAATPTPVETICGDLTTNMSRLLIAINDASTRIARHTRRGAGNFIIASPIAVSLLNTIDVGGIRFKPCDGDTGAMGLRKVGELVNSSGNVAYTVFVSLCESLSTDGNETFLIGYKGHNSEFDAGYVLSPYIPVVQSATVMDPATFTPVMPLITRYSTYMRQGKEFGDSGNYYEAITLDTTTMLSNVGGTQGE